MITQIDNVIISISAWLIIIMEEEQRCAGPRDCTTIHYWYQMFCAGHLVMDSLMTLLHGGNDQEWQTWAYNPPPNDIFVHFSLAVDWTALLRHLITKIFEMAEMGQGSRNHWPQGKTCHFFSCITSLLLQSISVMSHHHAQQYLSTCLLQTKENIIGCLMRQWKPVNIADSILLDTHGTER